MANTSSARKQHRKSLRQKFVNLNNLSRIKTYIKKILVIIGNKDKVGATEFFPLFQSQVMKGVKKGVMKLNSASRRVSNISKKIKNL